MTRCPDTISLSVSDGFHRLLAECMRLYAQGSLTQPTIGMLVETHAPATAASLPTHDVDTLTGHLATLPSSGPTPLVFDLSTGAAIAFEQVRQTADALLARALSDTDVLSLLLFDYVVTARAADFLQRFAELAANCAGSAPI